MSSVSVRTNAPHSSVQPMVANIRPSIATVPDPEELLARESIAQHWSKAKARKRTARVALLGLGAAAVLVAGAASFLHFGLRVDAAREQRQPDMRAGAAPPLADTALPTSATSVYSASEPVQSARVSGPRSTVGIGPAGHPPPKGSVNHLPDTRD